MATKKEFTAEELRAQYKKAEEELNKIHNELLKAEREEKEQREKKLAAEKESRYKEVIHAYENFEELRSKYVDDYGYFTFETKSKNGDPFDFFWKHCGWY